MWNDFRRSLSLRLALIFALGSLGTSTIISGFLYWSFQRDINQRNRHVLESQVQELAGILQRHPEDLAIFEREVRGEGTIALDPQMDLRILSGGQLLAETQDMAERVPPTWFVGQEKTARNDRRFLLREQRAGGFTVQGALDITDEERSVFVFRRRLVYTLLAGSLACAAFGWWAARRGLEPLRAIAESARGITVHRLQARLDPGEAPQELRDLVQALDDMFDRLDQAFSRLSQFSADLAHELRTPINNMMGEAEVALARERSSEEYRQVLESSLEEYQRLSRLISRMLFLARTEDPQAVISRSQLEAAQLVAEVIAYFEAAAEEQGVSLHADAFGTVFGDPDLLRQALANLLSNALGATPQGGRITVSLKPEGSCMEMAVRDTGRGIPQDEIPHLLDRFYRTQDAHRQRSTGTGLGLAIVRSIAGLHGGTVDIQSQLGLGTTVRVQLPRG